MLSFTSIGQAWADKATARAHDEERATRDRPALADEFEAAALGQANAVSDFGCSGVPHVLRVLARLEAGVCGEGTDGTCG